MKIGIFLRNIDEILSAFSSSKQFFGVFFQNRHYWRVPPGDSHRGESPIAGSVLIQKKKEKNCPENVYEGQRHGHSIFRRGCEWGWGVGWREFLQKISYLLRWKLKINTLSTLTSSLRKTLAVAPSSPKQWKMLYVKLS